MQRPRPEFWLRPNLARPRPLPRAPRSAQPSSSRRQYDVLALIGQTLIVLLVVALLFVLAVIQAAAVEVRQREKADVLPFKVKAEPEQSDDLHLPRAA
jgi:hypothetical protein